MEKIEVTWAGEGLAFEGRRNEVRTAIDGDGEIGVSPVGMLLEAAAACSAADVVDILRKGRQDLRGLTVHARGDRRDDYPRYYTRMEFDFVLSGEVDLNKAERAVELSFEKYCSVYHTLRKDLELEWSVTIEEAGDA